MFGSDGQQGELLAHSGRYGQEAQRCSHRETGRVGATRGLAEAPYRFSGAQAICASGLWLYESDVLGGVSALPITAAGNRERCCLLGGVPRTHCLNVGR